MTSSPRLTIVIPSRDGERTIGYTLRSLQQQTERNFETIVVDDGSTDATGSIARSFPGVVVVRHDASRGVSESRNAGAAIATSPWLCFLDDDDWFPAPFVEGVMALVEPGVALCYDSVIVVAEGGDEERAVVLESIFEKSALDRMDFDRASLDRCFDDMPILKSIVERTAFDRVGGFDPRYTIGEDFHYHIKLLAAGYRLHLVSEPHAIYRRRADSVTARAVRSGIDLRVAAARRWIRMASDMLIELDLPPRARVALRRDLLDPWRYRLVTAIVRSVAGGDRSPLHVRALPHVPGAVRYGSTVHWPKMIAARLKR